jgi:hypothetical protein
MTLYTLKKLCLLFLSANIFAMRVHAQIQYGIKGGLNISELLSSNGGIMYVDGQAQVARNFPLAGVNAGVFASDSLSKKLSLQPEILFSAQGTRDRPQSGYSITATERSRFNWINIPVLIKYHIPSGFFIETGPQVGFLVSAKISEFVVGSRYTDFFFIRDQYKLADFGWALGTGYVSSYNLGFDIRYVQGFTNISNVSASGMQNVPVQSGGVRNSVFQIGLFYLFGKSRTQADQSQ